MRALNIAATRLGTWYRHLLAAEPMVPTTCAQTLALTPVEQPGRPWQRHRHSLELQGWYAGAPESSVIVNQTRRQAFHWGWRYRRAGTTQFWVPSRYAELVNRAWQRDHWVLCAALPASTGAASQELQSASGEVPRNWR